MNCTGFAGLSEYIATRARSANLSKAQMMAMILTRWALDGGPAVDELDRVKLTPGLQLRAREIGEEAAEWHGWENFIRPGAEYPALMVAEAPPEPRTKKRPLTVKVTQRKGPAAHSETA